MELEKRGQIEVDKNIADNRWPYILVEGDRKHLEVLKGSSMGKKHWICEMAIKKFHDKLYSKICFIHEKYSYTW